MELAITYSTTGSVPYTHFFVVNAADCVNKREWSHQGLELLQRASVFGLASRNHFLLARELTASGPGDKMLLLFVDSSSISRTYNFPEVGVLSPFALYMTDVSSANFLWGSFSTPTKLNFIVTSVSNAAGGTGVVTLYETSTSGGHCNVALTGFGNESLYGVSQQTTGNEFIFTRLDKASKVLVHRMYSNPDSGVQVLGA